MVKKVRGKPCPWIHHDLRASMTDINRMLRKARKSKTTEDWNIYKRSSDKANLRKQAVNKLKKKSIRLIDFIWNYSKRLATGASNDFKLQNVSNAFVLRKLRKLNRNKDYRPISVLPSLSEILEKAIHQQLMDHI